MRRFGMEFHFMFLGSHNIKGNRLGYIIFLFWQEKIYRFNYREVFFPGTKFKEGFITKYNFEAADNIFNTILWPTMNQQFIMQMNGFYATTLVSYGGHYLELSLEV